MHESPHHDLATVRRHPYREILRLALPLVLSMSGLVLMQFVNGVFLAWYSPEALAASATAGMASYLLLSLFIGTAGYASAFIAQYSGAGEPRRIGPAVWQSAYLALGSGFITAAAAFLGAPLFRSVGHDPAVAVLEAEFFRVACLGGWTSLFASAFTTFFTGRGDTRPLMVVQLSGFALNIALDYTLIFGHFGLPRLGVTGAALATIIAQAFVAVALGALILGRATFRKEYATWEGRRLDVALLKKMIAFGLPNGFRFAMEMLAWVVFLFYIGRLGTVELATSTIAFRVNGFSFFPIIGLSQAVGILVGHAQGKGDYDLSVRVTGRGMLIAEGWMLACAALFLFFPQELYAIFTRGSSAPAAETQAVGAIGVVLLRFVAAYCSLDAANLIYVGALQYAGDTRWTFGATILIHSLFICGLAVIDRLHLGLVAEWACATVFVMVLAVVWITRFYRGRWHGIRLVGHEEPAAVS